MKARFIFLVAILSATVLLAFRFSEKQKTTAPFNIAEYKKKNLVRCGTDWEALKYWLDEVDMPVFPGAGIYKWKISTKNDCAQFYFNRGINMYSSIHIFETIASVHNTSKL